MKILILDEKTWRCGNDSDIKDNVRGVGRTALINNHGYMCCLGQFATQLNKKVVLNDEMKAPSYIEMNVPILNKKIGTRWYDTDISVKAMNINDTTYTTVEEKVKSLRKLFKPKGYKIIFRKIKK